MIANECGTRMPMRSQTALNWFLSFSTATDSASSVQHAQPSGSTSSAASASYTLHGALAHYGDGLLSHPSAPALRTEKRTHKATHGLAVMS